MDPRMKVAIIGSGTMGEAIVAAILREKVASVAEIRVADHVQDRLKYLNETFGVEASHDNREAARDADFVVLAVKPQDFETAAKELGALGRQTVVSIMAGITISRVRQQLGTEAIVRAMPNTPAQIGEGMTVWTATPAVADPARDGARRIFAAMGKEVFVPEERYLDMATALSGSGPAYVFLFLEALTDAGVQIGLSRDQAATLALQTVLGAARYAENTKRPPAELRAQVTSPGGTTAAALRVLEANGMRSSLIEAVIAAYERAQELGAGEAK
jgi:pyrroline-5-carboxylate reductase